MNGKYVPAFHIEYDADPAKYILAAGWSGLCLWIYFNCKGDPIPTGPGPFGSSSTALITPGAEWAYPKYQSRSVTRPANSPGMFQDDRTLDMMLDGCCPREIGNDMTGIWNVAD